MTQKDKELLLKDLCARLPYGVMLNIDYYDLQGDGKLKNRDVILSYGNIGYCYGHTNWVSVKPYLRSMSSMTTEEGFEFNGLRNEVADFDWEIISHKIYDWLNAHHFDYRGLIGKGLALEATEGMYDN